jgi:FkbM family methyltransferase
MQLQLAGTAMISQNHFTFPFYIPRVYRLCRNWPQYLVDYVLRRRTAAQYELRNGVRLTDDRGTLAGTIAVVFIRREYGRVDQFRTIVDIGANIGTFAVYAAQSSPEANIYCFEPETGNFESLKNNIHLNELHDRVSAFQCAVGSDCGDRQLAVIDPLSNSFHMIPDGGANMQTVACTSLTTILGNLDVEQIDLLKLNCEGAEYEILESCPHQDLDRISNIRLEYHNLDAPGKTGESLSRFLRSRGYRIQRFTRYLNTSGFIWAIRALSTHRAILALATVCCSPDLLALACESEAVLSY